MMEEDFAQGNSLLHSTDSRVKIIVAFSIILMVAITNNFTVVSCALLVALALSSLAFLPFTLVVKRLLAANSFILFLWITLHSPTVVIHCLLLVLFPLAV